MQTLGRLLASHLTIDDEDPVRGAAFVLLHNEDQKEQQDQSGSGKQTDPEKSGKCLAFCHHEDSLARGERRERESCPAENGAACRTTTVGVQRHKDAEWTCQVVPACFQAVSTSSTPSSRRRRTRTAACEAMAVLPAVARYSRCRLRITTRTRPWPEAGIATVTVPT